MKVAIGFQADVRVGAGLCGQGPQSIDRPALAKGARQFRQMDVQSSLPTQTGNIQPLSRERIHQHAGIA